MKTRYAWLKNCCLGEGLHLCKVTQNLPDTDTWFIYLIFILQYLLQKHDEPSTKFLKKFRTRSINFRDCQNRSSKSRLLYLIFKLKDKIYNHTVCLRRVSTKTWLQLLTYEYFGIYLEKHKVLRD